MTETILTNIITTALSPPLSPPHSADATNNTLEKKEYSDSAAGNSNNASGKRRLKVVSACNECRRKKVKCDGKAPCVCCIKSNKQGICKYSAATPSNNMNGSLGGGALLSTKGQSRSGNRHHPYPQKHQNVTQNESPLPLSNTTAAPTANSSVTMIESIELRLAAIEDVLQNFLRRHQEPQQQDYAYGNKDMAPHWVQKIREEVAEVRRIQLPPLRQYSGFPSSPSSTSPAQSKPQSAFTRPSISNHYPYYSPFSTTSCCSSRNSSDASRSITPGTAPFGRPAASPTSLASTPTTASPSAAGSAPHHYYPHHSYNSVY